MTDHQLKCVPYWFKRIKKGDKSWEIRKNDRDFRVGDWLILFEFNERGITPGYTGESTAVEVLSVDTSDYLPSKDFVIMSISPPEDVAEEYLDILAVLTSKNTKSEEKVTALYDCALKP